MDSEKTLTQHVEDGGFNWTFPCFIAIMLCIVAFVAGIVWLVSIPQGDSHTSYAACKALGGQYRSGDWWNRNSCFIAVDGQLVDLFEE